MMVKVTTHPWQNFSGWWMYPDLNQIYAHHVVMDKWIFDTVYVSQMEHKSFHASVADLKGDGEWDMCQALRGCDQHNWNLAQNYRGLVATWSGWWYHTVSISCPLLNYHRCGKPTRLQMISYRNQRISTLFMSVSPRVLALTMLACKRTKKLGKGNTFMLLQTCPDAIGKRCKNLST